jgi:hypothetical protein
LIRRLLVAKEVGKDGLDNLTGLGMTFKAALAYN